MEKNSKQYCWHSSVVNYELGIALVLRHNPDEPGLLEISAVPLSELLEQTLELIGTNINGNPYGEWGCFPKRTLCGQPEKQMHSHPVPRSTSS